MIGPALRAHLIANAAVYAIVSDRVYPNTLPQIPVMDCLTYQLIAEERGHTLSGEAFPSPYVQIDCWSSTYTGSGLLADAVSTCLDCFRGTLGSGGNTLQVSACLQRSRQELYEPETKEYRVALAFAFWHN